MGVRLGLATRDLTTPSGDTQEPEVVEEHRVSMTARCYSIRIPNSRLQELHHLDSNSEQFGSKESIKEETPVGLRTRSMIQQQHPTAHKDVNENGPEGPIEPEIKELLLQLIAQNKEQQDEMKHLRLALKQGLEHQESIVRELKEDIAALSMKSQEKKQLDVQESISDSPPLVKPFAPSGKLSPNESASIPDQPRSEVTPISLDESEFLFRSTSKQDVFQKFEASTSAARAYKAKTKVPVTPPNVVNNSKSSSRASNESDISEDSPQDEGRYQRLHCGNTPASRMGRWSRGRDTTNKSRKDTFRPPQEPKEVRDEANQKIDRALNHVPDVIHHNPKSKRTAVTLFAGNLDFNVRDKDILESLRTHFKRRIHVDVIDVPNFNGRHKGYAFITISWVRDAPVDPADICQLYSGMIQVNSRCLYFQELHDDVAERENERAYAARTVIPKESVSGYYYGMIPPRLHQVGH